MIEMPVGQTCMNKAKRCDHPASVRWDNGAGWMALTHHMYSWWCECCALDVQIATAEERSRALQSLKEKRATIVCTPADSQSGGPDAPSR